MSIKKNCLVCGEEFITYPSEIKLGRGKYCSKKCMGEAFKKSRLGENHPNWKEKIKCICKECGKEFYVNPCVLKNGRGKYCSKKCKDASQAGETNPLRKKIKRVCEVCNTVFFVMPYVLRDGGGKYCSSDCFHKGASGENSPMWKGGVSFEPYCPRFNKRRKEAVREFFGRRCLACGVEEKDCRTKLPVHHVDHDKEQGCDGKPFNLVPFCKSCHADELYKQDEYIVYVNKTLEEGFKWGIWNKEEYMEKVMYPDD